MHRDQKRINEDALATARAIHAGVDPVPTPRLAPRADVTPAERLARAKLEAEATLNALQSLSGEKTACFPAYIVDILLMH